MSITDPCRRCGKGNAWLLRPVRELDAVMAVETRGSGKRFERLGWYEAALCMGCGHTRFWARDYEPERARGSIDGCLECGAQSGWTVSEPPDLLGTDRWEPMRVKLAKTRRKLSLIFSSGGWNGNLAADVCGACGATAWRCRPEPAPFPEDLDKMPVGPRACGRCGGEQLVAQLSDLRDGRDNPPPRSIAWKVGFWEVKLLGRFDLHVCQTCFAVDWYGVRLDELREDPELGIRRLEREPGPADGGPYR